MGKVKERLGFADYLNVSSTSSAQYVLMGAGFTTLDNSPAAQTSSKKYVNQKSASKRIKGYDFSAPFTLDQIRDEQAVEFICNIGEKELTGSDAETDYVRVDLDKAVDGKEKTYVAMYHKVAIEVANFNDNDGEMQADGNLLGISDVVSGEFNTGTNTFKTDAEVAAEANA